MVDPDSDRVSRAPPYSGFRRRLIRFGYAALTHCGAPSQKLLLQISFLKTPYAVLQPHKMWFGLLPVRSPLLGESLLISVPELLRWFTSLSIAPVHYIFMHSGDIIADAGLLHSDIRGSKDMCSSPRLFAAYHVLLRLAAPRHPP